MTIFRFNSVRFDMDIANPIPILPTLSLGKEAEIWVGRVGGRGVNDEGWG